MVPAHVRFERKRTFKRIGKLTGVSLLLEIFFTA
jgi:hypothetical protein